MKLLFSLNGLYALLVVVVLFCGALQLGVMQRFCEHARQEPLAAQTITVKIPGVSPFTLPKLFSKKPIHQGLVPPPPPDMAGWGQAHDLPKVDVSSSE